MHDVPPDDGGRFRPDTAAGDGAEREWRDACLRERLALLAGWPSAEGEAGLVASLVAAAATGQGLDAAERARLVALLEELAGGEDGRPETES